MKRIALFFVFGLLAMGIVQANAAIGVGDSVANVQFQSTDGQNVSIGALKGKLIVIDFWATWCGPCMREAPHMVDINKKYSSKGLVMLGISLDQDQAAMVKGAKAASLNWPQTMDGGKFSGMFGVNSIPRTFLVGPDGKVLWTGHPAGGLDGAIEAAFRDHPPFMVDPSIVAEAGKVLDEVESKLSTNDPKAAMKLMAKVPSAASADDKFAARAKGVQKKLQDAGEAMLADVDAMIASKDYPQAVARLREISYGLSGTVAVRAKLRLNAVLTSAEGKAALAAADQAAHVAERNAKGAEALAAAEALKDQKKDSLAYVQFKAVAAEYADTPAGVTAAAQVKTYDTQHPEVARQASESAAAVKARAALSLANNYRDAGSVELARSKYKSIIASFPNTSFAETAKSELARLGN